MHRGQVVSIVGVALLIALGIAARVTVRTPNSFTRKRFLTWAPLAVLVLAYVVFDAMTTEHHWITTIALLLVLCTSTYDLVVTRRNSP